MWLIILLTIIFILIFFALHKLRFKGKNILRIILIVLVLEIYVFNINSMRLIGGNYEKKTYTEDEISVKSMDYNEDLDCYNIEEKSEPRIGIRDIETEVATIKIDAELIGCETLKYYVAYTDETSEDYRELPSKVLENDVERSKYTTCYLSGKSQKLRIYFEGDQNAKIKINSVTINEKVPFHFSLPRFLTLSIILLLIYGMTSCDVFKNAYSEKNKEQLLILIALTVVFIGITIWIAKDMKFSSEIYTGFTDSLTHGKISIEEEPPSELLSMENPYDNSTKRNEVYYIWDMAFYNNKYYCYFGILPFLISSLPVKLITNQYLGMNFAVMIFSIILIIGLINIITLLYKRWFKKLSFSYLILAIIGIISGSLIFWVNRRPDVYEFVTVPGVMFSVLGIWMMFKAIEDEEKIKYQCLTLSATSLALAVACRPNDLLVSFILLPKLIQILIKNIKEKKNVGKLILSVGIPYMIVGILLMIYNYIRFDSIFEFGSNYQLTVNDIKDLKHRIAAIPVGIATQLFKLPITSNTFPFFKYENSTFPFFGYYYLETLVCGLFVLNPINLILIFLIKLKKKIKEKEAYNYAAWFTIVGWIICILNIALAGSLQRYSIDYAWIWNIASYLTIFIIVSNISSKEIKKYILKITIFVTLYMLIANFIVGGLVSENNLLERMKPEEYYNIRYDICFWE